MKTQDTKADADVAFLRKVAEHFDALPTGGEDRAHWANVCNAANCRRIADRLAQLQSLPPTPDAMLAAREGAAL